MRPILLAAALTSTLLLGACASTANDADTGRPMVTNGMGAALDAAIAGSWRDPANVARDVYRHPQETLSFFGVRGDQTVIEITPPPGWYAEILAPYLRDNGQYVAAVIDPASQADEKSRAYYQKNGDGLQQKFDAAPAQYDRARIVGFDSAPRTTGRGASVPEGHCARSPGAASTTLICRTSGRGPMASKARCSGCTAKGSE